MLQHIENPVPVIPIVNNQAAQPILMQKLSKPFQISPTSTDHTLMNMSKSSGDGKTKILGVDPYRELPQ